MLGHAASTRRSSSFSYDHSFLVSVVRALVYMYLSSNIITIAVDILSVYGPCSSKEAVDDFYGGE